MYVCIYIYIYIYKCNGGPGGGLREARGSESLREPAIVELLIAIVATHSQLISMI